MGKKNANDDGRKTCSLCFCKTGLSQENLKHLPDGSIAEKECINQMIFKEIIVPVRKVTQLLSLDFNCLSQQNPPKEFFESVVAGIKKIPAGKIQEPLKSMEKISREIFGTSLQSFINRT